MLNPSLEIYAKAHRPEPLRVGVLLCSGCGLAESDSVLLSTLMDCGFVRIVRVITVPAHETPGLKGLFDPAHWLLQSYRTIDSHVLADTTNRTGLQSDDVRLKLEAWCGRADDAPDLDVLICFGDVGPVRSYTGLAKFGVWWVGPAAMPDRDIITSQLLKRLVTEDAPHAEAVWTLGPADAEPIPRNVAVMRPLSRLSVEKNLRAMKPLRPGMLLASLWQLGAGATSGATAALPAVEAPDSGLLLQENSDAPASVGAAASLMARLAFRHARHRVRSAAGPDRWTVGLRVRAAGRSHDNPDGYRWLNLPDGKWHADPFLFQRQGRTWLFYESIHDLAAPAAIACAEVDSAGVIGESQVVLRRPYHLSYPQVFTVAGEIYMIPESGTNGTVELYRARTYPDSWELVRVLQHGPWFDTTVAFHNDRYWFFSSLQQDKEYLTSQLVLFSSRQIDGDWIMHPQGPITFDGRYARGAGGIFENCGVKVRPAQDGSRAYGRSMHFMRIDKWDESEYRESPAWHLGPEGIENASGVHTYSRAGDFEVIDRKLG